MLLRVLSLVMHLILIPRDEVTISIALSCLRLRGLSYLTTFNHLSTLKLNISLSPKPGLLLLHFLNNLSLLLLFLDPLVIAPFSLGASILHLRFFLFVLIICFGWRVLSRFLLLRRSLPWLWTSIGAFFYFLGWLLLNLNFFQCSFLLYFLKLHLLLLINDGHYLGNFFNWQIILRWFTIRTSRGVSITAFQ